MFAYARERLQRDLAQNVCHGYALAIGRGGELLHSSMGGLLGGGDSMPVTESTRFDLGSLTGMLVTTPLALLALEKGWLCLTDKLSRYVEVPADKRGITLWHLLSQTSGMGKDFLLEQEAQNPEDALRVILARPLAAPVGKQAQHSGIGMALLGMVLEKVYGMPLDEAAKKHVFTPLGMANAGYLPTGANIACTTVDSEIGEPRVGIPNDENARFLHGVSGEAGLFADVWDCSRFLGMLAQGGRLEGTGFLSGESIRLMEANHRAGLDRVFGLGVQRAGEGNAFLGELWPQGGYGHMSQTTGCSLAVEPQSGLYVVVLMARVRAKHSSEGMQRGRRLLHNNICADFHRE